MKTIGLIGGLSWESSAVYYRLINEMVRDRLGGSHSAQSLMYSVDFAVFDDLQHRGDWDTLTALMVDAGQRLKRGGADFLVICTNTMHKMADAVERQAGLPLLHIADAAAAAVKRDGLRKVALLGTRFTMEQDFYKRRLADNHGIDVLIPDPGERDAIHAIIYGELVRGKILPASRARVAAVIRRLQGLGAQGAVLGCTELPLLVTQSDSDIPVYDTMRLHAAAAVDRALDAQ